MAEHDPDAALGQRLAQPHQGGNVLGVPQAEQSLDHPRAELHVAEDSRYPYQLQLRVPEGKGEGEGVVDVGADIRIDPDACGHWLVAPWGWPNDSRALDREHR